MSEKVSQLPVATAISGADLLPIVQGGVSYQATVSLLPVPPTASNALELGGLPATSYQLAAEGDQPKTWVNVINSSCSGLAIAVGQVMLNANLRASANVHRYYRVSAYAQTPFGQNSICEGNGGNTDFTWNVIRDTAYDRLQIIANQNEGDTTEIYYSVDVWE